MPDTEYNNPFDFSMDFDYSWGDIDVSEDVTFPGGNTSGTFQQYGDADWVTTQLLAGMSGGAWGGMWDPQQGADFQGGDFIQDLFEAGVGDAYWDSFDMSYGDYLDWSVGQDWNEMPSMGFNFGDEDLGGPGIGTSVQTNAPWMAFSSAIMPQLMAMDSSAPWAGSYSAGIGEPSSYANIAYQAGTGISSALQSYADNINQINTDFTFNALNLDEDYAENEATVLAEQNKALSALESQKRSLYRTGSPGLTQ